MWVMNELDARLLTDVVQSSIVEHKAAVSPLARARWLTIALRNCALAGAKIGVSVIIFARYAPGLTDGLPPTDEYFAGISVHNLLIRKLHTDLSSDPSMHRPTRQYVPPSRGWNMRVSLRTRARLRLENGTSNCGCWSASGPGEEFDSGLATASETGSEPVQGSFK